MVQLQSKRVEKVNEVQNKYMQLSERQMFVFKRYETVHLFITKVQEIEDLMVARWRESAFLEKVTKCS